jgi:PAS domain S-box-containing protein
MDCEDRVSTILVVDDLEPNRYALRVALAASGHHVLEAANGVEALAHARAALPDLIISDILMPQMDGFALCRECKRDERLARVPFVFYTATYTGARDREFAMQLGAARFYVKPVETAEFVEAMHEVLTEYASGAVAPPVPPAPDETTLYRLYNETLIRKLEDKMLELERLNTELTEAQRQLHLAMAAGSVGLWDWDLQTGRVRFSEEWARQIGFSPAELGDSIDDWRDRVHPDDLPVVVRTVQDFLLSDDAECSTEYRLRHRDGSYRRILARASAVRDEHGRRVRIAGSHVDITDYARLQAQLLQSQKMESVGQLAGGIAHDFNNLLAVIVMDADAALLSLPEDHPVAPDVLEIRQVADRAASMTRQLLAFSRHGVNRPKQLDLNDVIREVLGMLNRIIGGNIVLEFEPAEQAARVVADRGQVEQVVINLVINARDAMPAGGTITIATREANAHAFSGMHKPGGRTGPWVVLSVTDTGLGMDEETRSHIFEPFYTTKDVGKGTGLGLSTVYGIVDQSGGAICVHSEVGGGSTFEIYLPRVGDIAPESKNAAPSTLAIGDEMIFLVEEDAILQYVATRVLEGAGYRVLPARGPDDALKLIEGSAGAIRLVILGTGTVEGEGAGALEKIEEANPGTGVIFTAGPGETGRQLPGLGRRRWSLSKPYTAEQLLRTVRSALDSVSQ